MFRFVVVVVVASEMTHVVFLALRREEGRVEGFWPIPALAEEPAPKAHCDSASGMQPPLSAVVKAPSRLRSSPPKALADRPHAA